MLIFYGQYIAQGDGIATLMKILSRRVDDQGILCAALSIDLFGILGKHFRRLLDVYVDLVMQVAALFPLDLVGVGGFLKSKAAPTRVS